MDQECTGSRFGPGVIWGRKSLLFMGPRTGSELDDFDFDFVLQQHLLCGVSGWRGERAGRLGQPADSLTLPQFLILWQLPEENSNQG